MQEKNIVLMSELRMIVLWMLLSLGPFLGRAQLNLSPKQLDTIYVSELRLSWALPKKGPRLNSW